MAKDKDEKGRFKIGNSIGNRFKKGNIPWSKGKKEPFLGNTNGFKKGNVPWNKEKKCPSISKAMKGIKRSKETRQKISEAMKDREFSRETRKKMSLASLGKKKSLQHRMNISKAKKRNKKLASFYRKIGLMGVQKQQNNKEPTSIEKKVYDELKRRGFLFEKQKLINGKFLVDAYIPRLNLVVEVDGNYWHSLDRVKKKDKAENAYLKTCGFNMLRLSGSEVKDNSFKERLSL